MAENKRGVGNNCIKLSSIVIDKFLVILHYEWYKMVVPRHQEGRTLSFPFKEIQQMFKEKENPTLSYK